MSVARLSRQATALIYKDILIELRAREAITAMLTFSVMTLVMFNFAFRLRVDDFRPLTPAVLWVTLIFAGTLGLSRTLSSEQINQCMDGLLLAPFDRGVIFFAKALTNLLFMLLTAFIVLPLMAILFDESLLQPGVALVLLIGLIGYAGAGTLIATMAISTRAREVFLPILLLPLVLPLLVASVIATAGFLDRLPLADFVSWIGAQVAFIVIFWTSGVLFFEYLVEG